MLKISKLIPIFIIYISSLQGSAGSDDYEIIIPPQILTNLTWSQLGPRYQLEKPVQLEILGPRSYNVLEGEELALICQDINNRQNNKIAWRRKNGLMPNGERSVMGGQVIIEKIGRDDAGEYECWDLMKNSTNTHKYVNVLYRPQISVDKLYLSHQNTLTLELVCSAQSNPVSTLTWSRRDPDTGLWSPVQEGKSETEKVGDGVWTVNRKVGSSENLSVVVITNPMSDHLGHYVCTANNTLGTDFKTVHLKGFNEEIKDPMQVTMSKGFSEKHSILISIFSLMFVIFL